MKYKRIYPSSRELILEIPMLSKVSSLCLNTLALLLVPMIGLIAIGFFAAFINLSSLVLNLLLVTYSIASLSWISFSLRKKWFEQEAYHFDGLTGELKLGDELLFFGKPVDSILIEEKMQRSGRKRRKETTIQLVSGDEQHTLPDDIDFGKRPFEAADEIAEILSVPIYYRPL